MTENNEEVKFSELCAVISDLSEKEKIEKFLVDLLTPAELQSISGRWQVAKLLEEKVSYRDIYEKTGVSTATVTRVARALSFGEGGYRLALDRNKTKGD